MNRIGPYRARAAETSFHISDPLLIGLTVRYQGRKKGIEEKSFEAGAVFFEAEAVG